MFNRKGREERSANSVLFEPWIGNKCTEIVRFEYSWQFSFPPAGSVTVASFWRIIMDQRVVLCSLDDGQRFGLPKHVDCAQSAWEIVFGKAVRDVFVNSNGDLMIEFEGDLRLEIFINSSGHESWNAASLSNGAHKNIVAVGGGELAVFDWPRR